MLSHSTVFLQTTLPEQCTVLDEYMHQNAAIPLPLYDFGIIDINQGPRILFVLER
jgi:hypothetical protein